MSKRDYYEVLRVSKNASIDELKIICSKMQPGLWGKDNEMTSYQPEALREFLADERDVLLLACDGEKIAGVALCYVLPHPSGKDGSSLYVHELDTHPDYRQQGIATQLMQECFRLAKEKSLAEVWLGTEVDNAPANALYKKLKPSEIEPSITYSYTVK